MIMKMLKKGSHLIVRRLGMLMNLIANKINHKLIKKTYFYSQKLKNIRNIFQRKNFIHKVNNRKFPYKILIKGEEVPKLMGLLDKQIYLLLAKAYSKDKTQ